MRNYHENIKELLQANITAYFPKDAFLNYEKETGELRMRLEQFYGFGQTFIERKDMGFSFDHPIMYYSDNGTRNAVARLKGKYLMVEIFKGLFSWMNAFYIAKESKFDHNSIRPFRAITQAKGITPSKLLLQMVSLFAFYHEVGHLVQNSGQMLEEDYEEQLEGELSAGQVKVRHIRELDADWHASHRIAIHVKEFGEVNTPQGKVANPHIIFDIASLSLAGVYMYFISISEKKPEIYYNQFSHPHPSVRISYVIRFFFDNLAGNLPQGIDEKTILSNAIAIAAILMDEEGKKNIVDKFSDKLYKNIGDIEANIKEIMSNAETYPYTSEKLLKKD